MPLSFSSWFFRRDNTDSTSNSSKSHTSTVLASRSPAGPLHSEATGTIDHVLTFTLGAACGVAITFAWRRWGTRLRTADWITPNELARQRWVRGVVTSVGDADDFRLYHTPGFGWRWPLKIRRVPTRRKALKDQTIHVRIAGVDAPEGAHYGRPGQPHAEESLAWLRNRIHGKTVYCQLIRKDQYGRVVGIPLVPRPILPFKCFGSSLALEMLRAGIATTYQESGAEHGPWGREQFMRIEAEAREARRGMWRNGVNIETPGEYKKRYSAALAGTPASKEEGSESGGGGGGGGGNDQRSGWLSAMLK